MRCTFSDVPPCTDIRLLTANRKVDSSGRSLTSMARLLSATRCICREYSTEWYLLGYLPSIASVAKLSDASAMWTYVSEPYFLYPSMKLSASLVIQTDPSDPSDASSRTRLFFVFVSACAWYSKQADGKLSKRLLIVKASAATMILTREDAKIWRRASINSLVLQINSSLKTLNGRSCRIGSDGTELMPNLHCDSATDENCIGGIVFCHGRSDEPIVYLQPRRSKTG